MALLDSHPIEPQPKETAVEDSAELRQQFGTFVLFELLRRDALGEVYRAGQIGASGVDRLVSLRLFNGGDVDGERFWNAAQGRRKLRETLSAGPFSPTLESGFQHGVPYVAQEYSVERTLTEMLERARREAYPVPLEHALHIMDRVALCLHNAYQVRLEGRRVVHGFLTPELVQVSSEGEVRVAGFESTTGLLELPADGATRSALAGYLSPEVNDGRRPEPSDDVYSLGAMLAELLTGKPLPPLDSAGASRWVEAARPADAARSMPESLRRLLSASVLPREERPQTAEQWRATLLAIMESEGYSATTFNIAYLMHFLFGRELDQQVETANEEAQAEPAVPRELPPPEPEPILEPEPATRPEARSLSTSDSGETRRWIGPAIAAALLAGVGLVFLAFDVPLPGMGAAREPAPPTEEGALEPVVEALGATVEPIASFSGEAVWVSAEEPPLYPEEAESQIRSLVEERAGAMEANIRTEYDSRIAELRAELERARRAASTRVTVATRKERATPPRALDPPRTEPASLDELESPSSLAVEPEATASSAAPEWIGEGAGPGSLEPLPIEARAPLPASESQERAAEPEAAAEGISEPATTVDPELTPPKLVRQPRVIYPPAAKRLNRRATIKVRVLVDESGRVVEVEQLGSRVGLGFDEAALRAARGTRWTPGEKDGVAVEMWVDLSMDFRP